MKTTLMTLLVLVSGFAAAATDSQGYAEVYKCSSRAMLTGGPAIFIVQKDNVLSLKFVGIAGTDYAAIGKLVATGRGVTVYENAETKVSIGEGLGAGSASVQLKEPSLTYKCVAVRN